MPIVTNTFTAFDAKGNREDLVDVIYNIAPSDTPLMSAIPKTKATATRHEWQTDTLAAAAANTQLEGDDIASFDAVTPTVRPSNLCQISRKTAIVSRTQDVVAKAGRKRELAYQVEKKSRELKRDMELALIGNQASVAGTTSVARASAGLENWLTSNTSIGAGGANTGFNAGTGLVAARTDGTQRAFTEDLLKTVLASVYTNGGEPDLLIVSPFNKQKVSEFAGNATRMMDAEEGKLATAIDIYVSDFGEVRVVPDKFMRGSGRSALVVQTDMLALATLDPFQIIPLAKTGDAEKRMIITEFCLEVRNQAAHGGIFDITTA